MSVHLDHTIIPARDKRASADFLAMILGLEVSEPFGPFLPVETANGVKLDFIDADPERIDSRHYAFLVSEQDFDAIFGRIEEAGIDYFADPYHEQARGDQPPRRGPRDLLRRSRRPQPRAHHPPLRQRGVGTPPRIAAESLKAAQANFRNEIVSGRGGQQILQDDPSGNPIELFQPREA
jgi:hypothetical protein